MHISQLKTGFFYSLVKTYTVLSSEPQHRL